MCAIGFINRWVGRTRVLAVRRWLQRPQGGAVGPTAGLNFPACAGRFVPILTIS
eukprot:COSAG01_NODE_1017_length_12107_cov_114.566372_9_plen_54_part_00